MQAVIPWCTEGPNAHYGQLQLVSVVWKSHSRSMQEIQDGECWVPRFAK